MKRIVDALLGRIRHDFDQLTLQECEPSTLVIERFEMLFRLAISALKEESFASATSGGQICWPVASTNLHLNPDEDRLPAPTLDPSHHQMLDASTGVCPNCGHRVYSSIDPHQFQFDDIPRSTPPSSDQRNAENPVTISVTSTSMGPIPKKRRKSSKASVGMLTLEEILLQYPNAQAIHDMISSLLTKRHIMLHPLTWLVAASGSPSTLTDLFYFLKAMQGETVFKPPTEHASVPELVTGIETLESDILTASIVRRMYLARLYQQFDSRMGQYKGRVLEKSRVGKGVATVVIDDMARELPPTSVADEDFEDRRKRLQNKLNVSKPWYRLSRAFTESSLALIPRGLSNSMIETLHEEEIEALVSTMSRVRGSFLSRLCAEVQQALAASCAGHAAILLDNDLIEAAVLEYDSEGIISFVRENVQR